MFELEPLSQSNKSTLKSNTLLNTEELASILNVSPKTVRKWRYTKEIDAIKVGKKLIRFRWGDIQKWLERK